MIANETIKRGLEVIKYSIVAFIFSIALSGCTAQTNNSTNTTSIPTNPTTTAQQTTQAPEVATTQTSIFAQPSKTTGCKENNGLPDLVCTPGAANSAVTQDTINQTICVSGYTTTIRPPTSYTNNLKTQQIIAYSYSDKSLSSYEEDHFIPLEIGGSPDSPANLWPEPYSGTYGAKAKDKVENYLHTQICNGSLTLAEAQKEMDTNWETVYNAHYSTVNTGSSSDADDTTISNTTTAPVVVSTPAATPVATAPTTPTTTFASTTDPQVKKSTTGICHEKGVSQYYNQTKTFTPYNSIGECLASGGRLPK
jgi:hypothetical protein